MKKLKERWGITTIYQLLLIIAVFAINGSLSARISSYLMNVIGFSNDNTHWFIYYLILSYNQRIIIVQDLLIFYTTRFYI